MEAYTGVLLATGLAVFAFLMRKKAKVKSRTG